MSRPLFRTAYINGETWVNARDVIAHLDLCADSVEGFIRNRGSDIVAATLRQHRDDIKEACDGDQ